MKPPRVLFVGQNPTKDEAVPFEGTKSGKKLLEWVNFLGIDEYSLINASRKSGKVTIKDSNPDEIYLRLLFTNCDKVIALGEYAAKACDRANIKAYKLSHPSGLNRKLNSKVYVSKMLRECKEWLWA